MEVEERFGLKRKHTYDEIVAWLNSDPKGVPYPNRVAFQTYNSHVYGQLKDLCAASPWDRTPTMRISMATSTHRSLLQGRSSASHLRTHPWAMAAHLTMTMISWVLLALGQTVIQTCCSQMPGVQTRCC